jgi:hypothetical protein
VDATARKTPSISRWGSVAGIGFTVLAIYALVGPPWPPKGDAPALVWEAHLANAGNRLGMLASVMAATIAGVLFVAFMASLRARGVMAASNGLALLGYGSGLLFVMSIFAAFAAWASVPAGIQISGEPIPNGDLIRFFNDLGQAFVAIPAPLCAGTFALAVAADAGRTRALPQWLTRMAAVVGIAQAGGIFFFPFLLFPIWVATTGAVLLRRPSTQPYTTAARMEPTL